MAKREKNQRLQELFDAGMNVYSISKCNTINECLYEAYRSYVIHDKGMNNIYGVLGTRIHDKLEEIVQGKSDVKELSSALNQELLDLDMLSLDFPKDFKGGDSIRDNWVADMKHFCENFTAPKGTFTTEELVIYQLSPNRYVQGYIDLIRHNKDGTISIYDWKTSTKFSAADLLHHGRQLIFYALAKEAEGYKVRDVAWIMLKYCVVTFQGKKRANSKAKSEIIKVVNRGKLISELKNHIEFDLSELGYDEIDIEVMLKESLKNNSFDNLPENVKNNYIIAPYVCKYELTDELKRETINYLNQMADKFESLDVDDESQWPPRSFVRLTKDGKEKDDVFFCANLCGYRNKCVHFKRFKEQWELRKQEEDEFSDMF